MKLDFKYFQKSKAYLLPLIVFEGIGIAKPIETYMQVQSKNGTALDTLTPFLYLLFYKDSFYEKSMKVITDHDRYETHVDLPGNYALVVFDMSFCTKDFDAVKEGLYSEITQANKDLILNKEPSLLVKCSLFPTENSHIVEKELGVEPGKLTGFQLCEAPLITTDGEIYTLEDEPFSKLKHHFHS
jgi:hypothetical protein